MKERLLNEKRLQMEAQMSGMSDVDDESLSGQLRAPGDKGQIESPESLPPGSTDEVTLAAMNTLLRMMNAQNHIEHKRTLLLKKLISKIQPELMPEEVESRVQSLREKFKFFNLEQLRELVGEPPEESSNGSAEDTERESEIENGEENEREDKEEEEGEKGALTEASIGKSLTKYIEEYLDKDEQALLDSLDLDEEELAELEDEVTAELQQKLSELGFPADGMA